MKNRSNLNNILSTDRKTLYIILSIVMVSVLTLTVVYAALSTTLNINGNAEVSAASWDIYLDNVQLNNESATSNVPTISNKTTASFTTTLNKPGDFYEFTIDVVNNGSIDAMIDGVTKTPTLTTEQAKYLNYIVEYQNGESINNKQLVAKNSFVRLKVKVEFRKDITASYLPTTSETLSLSFTVNYVQSDETGTNVTDNGVKKAYQIVSGDLETVGSEVAIGDEHFYIISSDEDSVTMLAKYNLYVDDSIEEGWNRTPLESPTGKQDEKALGMRLGENLGEYYFPFIGVLSQTEWNEFGGNDGIEVKYLNNYKDIIEEEYGVDVIEARLITTDELENLGCNKSNLICSGAPSWIYSTSYLVGDDEDYYLWQVFNDGKLTDSVYRNFCGIRPVIVIDRLML